METLNYEGIDEKLYYFMCDNGLKVYLNPNNLSKNFFISLGVKYGASVIEYSKGKNKYKVTPGIAHFIEHRVLDFTKDKEAELKIRNLGSYPNACTNYIYTRYLMYGSLDINENMKVLFDRVFKPNFKASDIEKEKGIILEECYMYQDDPSSFIYDKLYETMYNSYYMKNPVIGTPESIKSINRDEIVRIYNDFYVPENMFLVITGNFDKNSVFEFITNYMKKIKYKKFEAKPINKKEKLDINIKYQEKNMDVTDGKVALGFKCSNEKLKKLSLIEQGYYFSILLNSMFSTTSDNYEKYKENKLISTSFQTSRVIEPYFFDIKILVDTKNPNEFINEIKKDLKNIKITESEFNRKKKVFLSDTVVNFEKIDNANDFISYYVTKYNSPCLDFHSIIKNLNFNDYKKVVESINIDNLTIMKIMK